MTSNTTLHQLYSRGSCLAPKNLQATKTMQLYSTRLYFEGRNWDPFSDLNTAMKGMEWSSSVLEKAFNSFSRKVQVVLPSFQSSKIRVDRVSTEKCIK